MLRSHYVRSDRIAMIENQEYYSTNIYEFRVKQ